MSVYGVESAASGVSWWDMLEQLRETQEQGQGPEQFAAQLLSDKDADGDSLLGLEESGLDEETFSVMDADGDGLVSADELVADMREKMEQMRSMMGELNMSMNGLGEEDDSVLEDLAASTGESSEASSEASAETSAAGGGTGEVESSEEYDELDLNEDGVVTMDELFQAYQSGAAGLSDLFGESGTASSMIQRLAMNAYAAQAE